MIDKLIRKRTNMLWLAVVGFSLWQIGILFADFGPASTEWTNYLQAFGMVVFGLSLLRLAQLSHATQDPNVAERLNDELTQLLRYRSFYFSYWIIGGVIALLVAASPFVQMRPEIIVRSLLVMVVAAPIGAFLWLDHRAGSQE